MKIYPENYDVAIDVLFTDLNGAAIVPTQIRAVLHDGDDEEINDMGVIPFTLADGKVTITIGAAFNVLGTDELSAVRILKVELETAAGIIRRSSAYIIEGETRLEIMNNSFMSLEAADALARDIPNLTGWAGASDEQRGAALINAYARLTRIQMAFSVGSLPVDTLAHLYNADYCYQTVLSQQAWAAATKTDFLSWPKAFRTALRQAQLVEANSILTDNPIEARHRAGIISETVGESSIMLRGGRLELGVSSETLRYLTGYVYYNVRIARA